MPRQQQSTNPRRPKYIEDDDVLPTMGTIDINKNNEVPQNKNDSSITTAKVTPFSESKDFHNDKERKQKKTTLATRIADTN